jgi:hypothetical protein
LERTHRRVVSNSAEYFAGGIYAESSAISASSLELRNNVAGLRPTPAPAGMGYGGGLAAYSSVISVFQLRVEDNRAERYGGGIWLQSGSGLDAANYLACPSDGPCHYLSRNDAGEAGGAVWLGTDANVSVDRARLEANRASTGAAVFAEGGQQPGTEVSLRNSLLYDNTASSALIALGNSHLTLALSTLVDNNTGSSMVLDFGGNTHDWRASLMYGTPGSVVLSAPFGTTLTTDCLIGHENASVLAAGGDVFVDEDPGFENRGSADFRLRADSGQWTSAATAIQAASCWTCKVCCVPLSCRIRMWLAHSTSVRLNGCLTPCSGMALNERTAEFGHSRAPVSSIWT